MRLVSLTLGMTLALASLAGGEAPPSPLLDLRLELVTVGLIQPVAIASPGDGSGRFFIAQQGGQLAFFDGSRVLSDLVLDLSSKVNCCFESGLLGLVPHPRFAENGYLFLAYTDRQDNVVVSRFHVSGDPPVADPASETVVLVVEQPSASHNGGQLLFGLDGFLYMSLGDGSGPSGEQNAQRLETLLGSILRIDVDHGEPYAIPGDNPFAGGVTGREEIWLYGLRNPWRFSFDRLTGDMFIGDVGDRVAEEINFYPARSRGGANFGWASMEGSHCFSPSTNCEDPSFTPPIIEYEHRLAGCGGAVIGGYRYRGRKYPQLYGLYFFADYCAKEIYAASESGGEWTTLGGLATSLSISSFGEDENGEIYVVDHGLGHILHIAADVPAPQFSLISPGQAVAGTPELTLALVGENFVPGSEAYWDGEVRPTEYLDKNRLLVSLAAEDIAAAGSAEVKVVTPGPGGGSTDPKVFTVLTRSLAPVIKERGVVEAASFNPELGVAPGSIASVFGVDLAVATEDAPVDPLPSALGGASFVFPDGTHAPQFHAGPGQHNIQIPWELAAEEGTTLQVAMGDEFQTPVAVQLAAVSPGIFSLSGNGQGQGAVQIAGPENALAAPEGLLPNSRPALPGEIVTIFANGLGPVTNPPVTGAATPNYPVSETLDTPVVTIGGAEATVLFSGLTPGSVALYQINVRVPADVPPGMEVPVTLEIGGKLSNMVTIAVAGLE